MQKYERHLVWSVRLRVFHWLYVLSTAVLLLTGFYIHMPWFGAISEGVEKSPMYMMRFHHVAAGYLFCAVLVMRFWMLGFGTRYEKFSDFAPISKRNLKNLFKTTKLYLYFSNERQYHPRIGHNALAGLAYLTDFIAAIVLGLSGFYLLYPESGVIQALGVGAFGSQAQARFLHHALAWFAVIFIFLHVYIAVWNDVVSREGLISSIFTGRKYFKIDKK